MSCPAGYKALSGRKPSGSGYCDFLVGIKHLDHLQRYGPSWKFYNLHILSEILSGPTVIFEGLNRDDCERGFCYSGLASKRMQSIDITLPPPPNMVAVVFVLPDHRGNIVLDWEWRPEHPESSGWPETWQEDFKRVIWQTT
jgi:hypothetical protein